MTNTGRIALLGGIIFATVTCGVFSAVPAPDYWPTQSWRESTPEQQGIDSQKLSVIFPFVEERRVPIHSLLLIRNGYVVLDAVFYPYSRSWPHDIASCTKTVTATLVGAAIGQHKIASVRDQIALYQGKHRISGDDWAKITVEDLLTMRSGIAAEAQSGEPREMRASPDWIQFVLDQPLRSRPGTEFIYSSSAMHLLAATLSVSTHLSPLDFAHVSLFKPLGIDEAIWPADMGGVNHGWGDLFLYPRDMAKIGFLFLQDGIWDGQQVLPADFVRAATRLQAKTKLNSDYGYGWWIMRGDRAGDFEAVGRGGQRISVLPRLNLIAVMTGGGFEPGEVGKLVLDAIRSDRALQENPQALATLHSLIRKAEAKPQITETAQSITTAQRQFSGEYTLSTNFLELSAIGFDFKTSPAILKLRLANGELRRHPIGLGGVPLFSPGGIAGLPVAVSATWTSETHLKVVYDEVASINCLTFEIDFSESVGHFSTVDRTASRSNFAFEGRRTVNP